MYPDDDPGWKEVQARIAAALEPFAEDLGPRVCDHGSWADCEEGCAFSESKPKPNSMPMLARYVLVATVEDTTDEPIITMTIMPGQRHHETKGLLHVALYE
jgi:hypothetical protein